MWKEKDVLLDFRRRAFHLAISFLSLIDAADPSLPASFILHLPASVFASHPAVLMPAGLLYKIRKESLDGGRGVL